MCIQEGFWWRVGVGFADLFMFISFTPLFLVTFALGVWLWGLWDKLKGRRNYACTDHDWVLYDTHASGAKADYRCSKCGKEATM